jgi:hypothetical protein
MMNDHRSHLQFQRLRFLPREILVGEVAILCCLAIDGSGQVELADDHTRSHVEILLDNVNQLLRGQVRSPVRLNKHRKGFGNPNGI